MAALALGSMTPAKAQMPPDYSLGVFNPGWAGSPAVTAVLDLEPHIGMVRTQNVSRFAAPQCGADNPNRYDLALPDPGLEALCDLAVGWNRCLYIFGDKDDCKTPDLSTMKDLYERTIEAFPLLSFIQIYNESVSNFADLGPSRYVEHACALNELKKEENLRRDALNAQGTLPYTLPHIVHVSGATFGDTTGKSEFQGLLKRGLADCTDILGIHLYGDSKSVVRLARTYREMLNAMGRSDMPLWVTETGVDDHTQQDDWYETIGRIEDALADGYTGTMPQRVFVYQLDAGESGFSLITQQGQNYWFNNTDLEQLLFARPRTDAPIDYTPQQPIEPSDGLTLVRRPREIGR